MDTGGTDKEMRNPMKLQNKTIVITGVSSGIGEETARALRQNGATVIGVDRNDPLLTIDQYFQTDLGNPASITELVNQLPDGIDGLCNIAGVPGTAPADTVARVNYLGLRELTEKALPNKHPRRLRICFNLPLGPAKRFKDQSTALTEWNECPLNNYTGSLRWGRKTRHPHLEAQTTCALSFRA